jgi:nicotinamidase-related amidase
VIAIEPKRTALLVMDFQNDVLSRIGDKAGPLLERAAGVIAAARRSGLPIIHVMVGFRPGYPEVNPRNLALSAITQTGRLIIGTPGADIAGAIRPPKMKGEDDGDAEVVVIKRRVSAFAGTDLEVVLRAKEIDTLVLCGVSTSGVVLSTVRHAADADYRVVVIKDGCADPDDEVHRVLTEKVFVRQASVLTADELTAVLAGA